MPNCWKSHVVAQVRIQTTKQNANLDPFKSSYCEQAEKTQMRLHGEIGSPKPSKLKKQAQFLKCFNQLQTQKDSVYCIAFSEFKNKKDCTLLLFKFTKSDHGNIHQCVFLTLPIASTRL